MPNRNLFESHAGLNPVVILQPHQSGATSLPAVPVMPETLLLLELVAQEPSVDLAEMSQLVLDDLGATLQILRLAGREYGHTHGRPRRIEDCISLLGVNACLQAVSEETAARHRRHKAVAETWAHARETAQYSKQIADDLPGVNPNEAYLVGLLHSIGSLPGVLGWDAGGKSAAEAALNGFQIAKNWSLPRPVLEFFSETQTAECKTGWSEVVRSAHLRATRSSVKCPFELEFRPMLIGSV